MNINIKDDSIDDNYVMHTMEIEVNSCIKEIKNFNSAIGLQEVKTKGTKAALIGKTGAEIFPDYRGVNVLSAYKPLNIKGIVLWGLALFKFFPLSTSWTFCHKSVSMMAGCEPL